MTLFQGLLMAGGALLLSARAASAAEPKQEEKPRVIPRLDQWEARVYKNAKGETLPYRLLKPKPYRKNRTYPLVVFLHGMGERGSDNLAQLDNGVSELFASDAARADFPAVVIAPQCPDGEDSQVASWSNWEPDKPAITVPTRLVLEIVEAVRKEFPIDPSRLYIGGLSMGGFGTWAIITENPDLFAAAFPICGGGDPAKAPRVAKLPLWVFHGAKDTVVDPDQSRRMVRAIQEAGGSPGFSEYPEVGHNSWTNAFHEPALLAWLFAQKR